MLVHAPITASQPNRHTIYDAKVDELRLVGVGFGRKVNLKNKLLDFKFK